MRDPRVLLLGITLLGLACRTAGVGHRLVLDEGYTWLVGSAPGAHAFLGRLAMFENTPPLYYVLLTPLPLDHEFWVRLPALLAGAATVPVLYAVVRPLCGVAAALLGALTLAVAPYEVATANLARGFTLATFGLLVGVWAAVRLADGGERSWWWVYGIGGVIAVWSEYYAVLTLIPLAVALLVLRVGRARDVIVFGGAPVVTMIPWAWQVERSLNLDGVTKVLPTGQGISLGVVRDEIVPLFFGKHGESAAGRGLELVAVGLAVGAAAWLLRRDRRVLVLAGAVAAGTFIAHAAAAEAGPGVFERRYLGVLVPLAIAVLAGGLVRLRGRSLVPVAACALVVVGLGVIVKRTRSDPEPDYQAVTARVAHAGVTRLLTNSPVVEYYLERSEPVTLDRPFNLGPGREGSTPRPYAVADDSEVGYGARPGPGAASNVGRIHVRVVGRLITPQAAQAGRKIGLGF